MATFHEKLFYLENKNNSLKSKLLHEQLKCNNYKFKFVERDMGKVLGVYKTYKSISCAAMNAGVDVNVAFKWYFEGQKGNPYFKSFYKGIVNINNSL